MSPPVFSTITIKAKLKNRLPFGPTLLVNAKSDASVNPVNRVAREARSYGLIWKIYGLTKLNSSIAVPIY